jgi:hypothetical protein
LETHSAVQVFISTRDFREQGRIALSHSATKIVAITPQCRQGFLRDLPLVNHPDQKIIDGSSLSLRETAALTHHCSLLLGCSSGITWVSTSQAARQLPMIQLLNAYTTWVNPVSRDFKRFGLPENSVIELTDFNKEMVVSCIQNSLQDFAAARNTYNQAIPLHFKTTRNIVYNLLCYLHFKAIVKHIIINTMVYGFNLSFYKEVLMGFIIFPFRLVYNIFQKRVFKVRSN